ncbi:response regulator [Rhodococcus sp. NPDC078407]|uniref:response regulator n=1 Tax=Rhodococcus sp. NPDC078407 TaxID=3364509 RepID=UPI0037C58A7B
MTITVLIVDDQTLVRSGIRLMLTAEDDVLVVGEASNGRDAVTAAESLRPDVVLMDVEMPIMSGIEATEKIVTAETAKVIVLTTFDRDDYLFDALHAGASGFLLKNSDPEALVAAIGTVSCGHALLAPEVTLRVIEESVNHARSVEGAAPPGRDEPGSPCGADVLTVREREVLSLLVRGRSNSEIAKTLVVGEATVKTHVSNLLTKLACRDRVQLVVLAYECGFVRPGDESGPDDLAGPR